MKKLNKILVLYVLLSVLTVDNSYSQVSAESNGYNPLSLRQVHESYLMWKKTLWRRVDLKEKQNKPFFARNREMSKIIIEAVERGVLIPYNSDSVNDSNVMAREEFIENIQQVEEEAEEEEINDDGGYELLPHGSYCNFDLRRDILTRPWIQLRTYSVTNAELSLN